MSFFHDDIDPSQPVIYIPCNESAIGTSQGPNPTIPGDDSDQLFAEGYSPFDERDLPGGYVARFNLYRAAWGKCLDRIEHIVGSLHAPVVDEIVRSVHRAYDDVLPGLPYPELPVIAISGSSTSQGFIANVVSRLGADIIEDTGNEDLPPSSYIIHLHPSDCPNIMSAMKALVAGRSWNLGIMLLVKRKPTTSLANYDIELLKVWHGVLRDAADGPEPPPQLVVFLHEFEQFDEAVVQDVSYVPQLPLIFVLALSSPHNSFLHNTYPHSVLSLLRVDAFTVPSGIGFLERVVTETFFDLYFEPDIMVVEGALLILQLGHLKHFDEPLTVFVQDERLGTSSVERAARQLLEPKAAAFLTSLFSWSFGPQELASNAGGWPVNDVTGLLASIAEARADFRSRLYRSKLAFKIMRIVQKLYPFSNSRGVAHRKLSGEKLLALMQALRSFFDALPDHPDEVHEARQRVATTARLLEDNGDGSDGAHLADEFGDWLIGYFQEHIINLEDLRLWEIWHTGSTPFPSEMLNPAPRATVVSALLQPHAFLPQSRDGPTTERLPIWKLPDVSILFRRYLEAGRMINVYDWYESFSQVIESQRSHLAPPDEAGRDNNLEEEEWKMHVQARFMRALHTLDIIGLVKHTGRKADHVMRTVYDMPE
ncbi:hypothetical protein F5148DRAFT_1280920 [Russula earlei]|uniref:Uncharacterized protein n=1 Tax=Russula earlei TaxID=71964 RepID=A0ACC0UIG2_9AGAM|nr:hypothetical protein F5148DRAFT_1280920 [Russula earlei]